MMRERWATLRMAQVARAWVRVTKKGTGRCVIVFLFTTHIADARTMYATHTRTWCAESPPVSLPHILVLPHTTTAADDDGERALRRELWFSE